MNRSKLLAYLQINIGLLVFITAILLIISINLIINNQGQNRYALQFQAATREIFVFDQQTGKLFITSPEMSADYNGEMWTRFDPAKEGNSLQFKKFLSDKADFEARKQFLEEVKRKKEEMSK